MKGYSTDSGYMGYVDGRYILFCSEGDFLDYFRETQEAAADSLEEAAQKTAITKCSGNRIMKCNYRKRECFDLTEAV